MTNYDSFKREKIESSDTEAIDKNVKDLPYLLNKIL